MHRVFISLDHRLPGVGTAPVFRVSAKGASGSEAEYAGVFHILNMIGADAQESRGLGDVYKRQVPMVGKVTKPPRAYR